MVDRYFVRGKKRSSQGNTSNQRRSLSRTRPTATRAPTYKHSVKLSCQEIWLRAATKKNKEARRVARSAAGVGGVIERMGSGQELVKHKPVRHKIEND